MRLVMATVVLPVGPVPRGVSRRALGVGHFAGAGPLGVFVTLMTGVVWVKVPGFVAAGPGPSWLVERVAGRLRPSGWAWVWPAARRVGVWLLGVPAGVFFVGVLSVAVLVVVAISVGPPTEKVNSGKLASPADRVLAPGPCMGPKRQELVQPKKVVPSDWSPPRLEAVAKPVDMA